MKTCPGADDLGEAELDAAHAAAARHDVDAVVSCAARAARHRADSSPATPRGDKASRIGTSRVLVRVCQCSTVRPVLRTKGYSAFGCSGNGSHSSQISLRASVGGFETAVLVEAEACGSSAPSRKRPLDGALLFEQLRR